MASAPGLAGRHLLRYGYAGDQKFLVGDFLGTYDQLVINANIVGHMPAGLASFLMERAKGKPYFIDPQTHAFQHEVGALLSSSAKREGEIKRSIASIIEAYGDPVESIVGGQDRNPLLPDDLRDDALRKGFCERVIKFQLTSIANQIAESDSAKYFSFLKAKGRASGGGTRPSLVVAPYFYLSGNTFPDWLDVNMKCFEDSRAAAEDVPLAAELVISRDVLANPRQREELGKMYGGLGGGPVLVWVDSFPEDEASEQELLWLAELMRTLCARGGQVANLYGGFLSVALGRVFPGLAAVTHGLEYGEDRPVRPVGGGFPLSKFYLPALHRRLPFREALRAARALGGLESADAFQREVCDCPECREVISGDPRLAFYEYGRTRPVRGGREIPTPKTKEHCVRHYMWAKEREYGDTRGAPEIAHSLGKTATRLERALGAEAVAHCRAWAKALEGFPGE